MITNISQLDLNGKYSYADYLTWQLDEYGDIVPSRIFPELAIDLTGIFTD